MISPLKQNPSPLKTPQGILLVNKPRGANSFSLVKMLRKRLNVQKIGHSGILDPFATGVMVMLVGRQYTRLSDNFLTQDKEYIAEVHFGKVTDTFDCDGKILETSDIRPTEEEILRALGHFQGTIEQVPPMFSAKKIDGKKLYELARQGKEVERKPVRIQVEVSLIKYEYPHATLQVICSKGTYVRSIAHDLGKLLGCGAHLSELQRVRSGQFHLNDCIDGQDLLLPEVDILSCLQSLPLVS